MTNDFNSITIGRSGAINIGAITFYDPVTIQSPAPGGTIAVNGQITGASNASITLRGGTPQNNDVMGTTTLNADIVTVGNAITIDDDVLLRSPSTVTLNTTSGASTDAGVLTQWNHYHEGCHKYRRQHKHYDRCDNLQW